MSRLRPRSRHFLLAHRLWTSCRCCCVFRVYGSGICCGRFCPSLARTCDSRDFSLNTRTSWSCCETNNTRWRTHKHTQTSWLTQTRSDPLWTHFGLSRFLSVWLKHLLLHWKQEVWKLARPSQCGCSPGRSGCLFFYFSKHDWTIVAFVLCYVCFFWPMHLSSALRNANSKIRTEERRWWTCGRFGSCHVQHQNLCVLLNESHDCFLPLSEAAETKTLSQEKFKWEWM